MIAGNRLQLQCLEICSEPSQLQCREICSEPSSNCNVRRFVQNRLQITMSEDLFRTVLKLQCLDIHSKQSLNCNVRRFVLNRLQNCNVRRFVMTRLQNCNVRRFIQNRLQIVMLGDLFRTVFKLQCLEIYSEPSLNCYVRRFVATMRRRTQIKRFYCTEVLSNICSLLVINKYFILYLALFYIFYWLEGHC